MGGTTGNLLPLVAGGGGTRSGGVLGTFSSLKGTQLKTSTQLASLGFQQNQQLLQQSFDRLELANGELESQKKFVSRWPSRPICFLPRV